MTNPAESDRPVPHAGAVRVLLVEDNFFVARDVQRRLVSMGLHVVGPVPSLKEGLDLVASEALGGAILDVNIVGGTSVAIAEELLRRRVPFFFITGYASPLGLPDRLKQQLKLHKPVDDQALRSTVTREFCGATP